jgi:D-alanyl-D-alanine carboxypeptidase
VNPFVKPIAANVMPAPATSNARPEDIRSNIAPIVTSAVASSRSVISLNGRAGCRRCSFATGPPTFDGVATRLGSPGILALAAVLLVGAAAAYASNQAATSQPTAELPTCAAGNAVAERVRYEDWAVTLLDPAHRLPENYLPPDLERHAVAGRPVVLRAFVFAPLRAMLDGAAKDGVAIGVNSSFRSVAQQAALEASLGSVDDLVARAGHSEHQLGTALDLSGGYDWLSAHAAAYGFAISYPPGRSPAYTCYRAEPWHVRYVGVENAVAIAAAGVSVREWLWTTNDAH